MRVVVLPEPEHVAAYLSNARPCGVCGSRRGPAFAAVFGDPASDPAEPLCGWCRNALVGLRRRSGGAPWAIEAAPGERPRSELGRSLRPEG